MNLKVSGHHLEVTPAIRDYVQSQARARQRATSTMSSTSHVILSVEKLEQKAEVTLHVRGKDIHCASEDGGPVRGHRPAGRQARPPGAASTRTNAARTQRVGDKRAGKPEHRRSCTRRV